MPLSLLALYLLTGSQRVYEGLPKFVYTPATTVGQREIVLGPLLQADTSMEVRFDNDVPARIGEGRIAPPSWYEYAKGYVRWSVADGMLFEKTCRVIKMDSTTKGENRTKLKRIGYSTQNTTTWWIAPDGKVLRQAVTLIDPTGKKHAEVVYWPDHLEVSIVDSRGNRSFTLNPAVDMSLLNAQFKPMLDGDKIVLDKKDYLVFDPFSGTFDKFTATVSSNFHGTWLGTKFEGRKVEIEGAKSGAIVYISKDNDLIKVDLPEHTAIVLSNLPHQLDPLYNLHLKKKGG